MFIILSPYHCCVCVFERLLDRAPTLVAERVLKRAGSRQVSFPLKLKLGTAISPKRRGPGNFTVLRRPEIALHLKRI